VPPAHPRLTGTEGRRTASFSRYTRRDMLRAPVRRLAGAAPHVALLIALCSVAATAAVEVSQAGAASARRKVADIAQFADAPQRQPHRTTVTEHEVNSYLSFDAAPQIPPGVVDPRITIVGEGRVAARAVVDLDAVRQQNPQRGLFDPMSYISGKVPVTATGLLVARNGVGHIELETAAIGPLPVPKLVLQEIISYYSRTPDKPGGIGLDDPFMLPARIREIVVQTGQAVVVQ
jgi:hypothetical protein